MRALLIVDAERLELPGPLASALAVVAEHLPEPARKTLERLQCLDRDRARGQHVFELDELHQLLAAAHALLVDPPPQIRKTRRIAAGPLPSAERVGSVVAWLRDRRERGSGVVYDLWGADHSSTSS